MDGENKKAATGGNLRRRLKTHKGLKVVTKGPKRKETTNFTEASPLECYDVQTGAAPDKRSLTRRPVVKDQAQLRKHGNSLEPGSGEIKSSKKKKDENKVDWLKLIKEERSSIMNSKIISLYQPPPLKDQLGSSNRSKSFLNPNKPS